MKIKRLWLEDIKYGLICLEERYFVDSYNFYTQRIHDVLGPFYNTLEVSVQTLKENAKVSTFCLSGDSSQLTKIGEKHLMIFSHRRLYLKQRLPEKDIYYFDLTKIELIALGCNIKAINQLENRYYNNQGVTVLHQGKLYFCNFDQKPTWSINHLPKNLIEKVRQLLLGLYSSQSSLFRLDLNVFHRIVFWLVELDNAYEEI